MMREILYPKPDISRTRTGFQVVQVQPLKVSMYPVVVGVEMTQASQTQVW